MKIPFGLWARVGSRNHALDWVQVSHGKGNFGGKGQPIVKYRDAAVSHAKPAEPIEMPFGLWTRVGPRNHVGLLDGVQVTHTGKGIFGGGRPL